MSIEIANYLVSPDSVPIVAEAAKLRDDRFELLQAITRLRKRCAPDQALAAWELVHLRRRATDKFGDAAEFLFFTREALEQASSLLAAQYHARRFASIGCDTVREIGCGIGADTIAFARAGMHVHAFEIDAERAVYARANLEVLGLTSKVELLTEDGLTSNASVDGIWMDPARRRNAKRVGDPDAYSPPLSSLRAFSGADVKLWGVKIAPSVNHDLAQEYGCALEFLSDSGECKEGILWGSGTAQRDKAVSAVVLVGQTEFRIQRTPGEPIVFVADQDVRYLFEPDPAIIRANAIETLGKQLNARPIDPRVAYLVGNEIGFSTLADTYAILERTTYSRRNLQSIVDQHEIGKLIIKKRGFDIEPEILVKQLKFKGKKEAIVVISRSDKGHDLLLVERRFEEPSRLNLGGGPE